jgi:progranulin
MRLLPATLWLYVAAQIDAQQVQRLPTAVRRMTPDDGEKFFPEYYAFANEGQPGEYQQMRLAEAHEVPRSAALARRMFEAEDARLLAINASAQLGYRPPFAPHTFTDEDSAEQQRRILGRRAMEVKDEGFRAWGLFQRAAEAVAQLEKRQWACPNGTSSCSNIGYPDSCCSNGETCVIVTDTGLGSVGCCPSGSTCGGTVGDCSSGSTACSSSQGGGCCIPGYVCEGIGCKLILQSDESRARGLIS